MRPEEIPSPEKATTRKVSVDDWELFRNIRLTSLQTDPQAFGGNFAQMSEENEESWRKRLSNPDLIYFAAEEKSAFVAIVGAKKESDKIWHIISVYTSPEARGHGLAKKLILQTIDEITKAGVNTIQLMVNADQENALALYTKLGFRIIQRMKDQKMGDRMTHNQYLMEKIIG